MMKKQILTILLAAATFSCKILSAQDVEQQRNNRIAAQKDAKKDAEERIREEIVGFSFIGGSFKTFGVSFACNFDRSNVGFFASVRGSSERPGSYDRHRGLAINAGVIKHIAGEFYIIGAGGFTDLTEWHPITPTPYYPNKYFDDEYTQGFETLVGVMYRYKRIMFQGGVSLMNFSKPEYVFGIGFDWWRKVKLD